MEHYSKYLARKCFIVDEIDGDTPFLERSGGSLQSLVESMVLHPLTFDGVPYLKQLTFRNGWRNPLKVYIEHGGLYYRFNLNPRRKTTVHLPEDAIISVAVCYKGDNVAKYTAGQEIRYWSGVIAFEYQPGLPQMPLTDFIDLYV